MRITNYLNSNLAIFFDLLSVFFSHTKILLIINQQINQF